MFDEFNICPYTGLRAFTEEESIYFKGRDGHIEQATAQLEKNKFLMLTGASGDGKSSLVYAGIIPNARAGFLKATYSNWQIADFRPERSPFLNLCSGIARSLHIENVATVEAELQHGFSALIDLYKSSTLYIDKASAEYKSASEDEQKKMQHGSANLLILVDQFEEYFTNPENYVNGIPSNRATLTINLLLETARIALEEGIPIYVVFTMRSDFIGQCAAFRELPKYIGFSQFFVPRLNRKLLQEVIEEPCKLSGNKITRRLTERIIHDIDDGIDQLPILQHALNQIWKAADNGKEEMDLLHYAMVGGLDPKELPDEDLTKFYKWYGELPKQIQHCFHARSLHNVLDTHANKIYESAEAYLKEKTGQIITRDIAHEVIKIAFTSLTKIDQSREVRNRMTLEEIRDILNNPEVSIDVIAGILNVFREQGNTFIRPFILDDPSTHNLEADSVLDITHESLIRNWEILGTWTKEEFDKFTVFKDFKQQVDRWLDHGKSGGFLLPIGSLTFFENWYKEVRINKHWVNRYNEQVTDTPKNLKESTQIVDNSNEFLEKSARKHLLTRAVVKFGPRKIAAVVGILIFLILSSFYYYDFRKRNNDYVLNQIQDEVKPLLNGDKAGYDFKATYVINSERIEKGQFVSILNDLETDQNRFKIALAAAVDLVHNDRNGNLYLKKPALLYADSMATLLYSNIPESPEKQNEGMKDLLNLAEVLEYYMYYFEDDEKISWVQANINSKLVVIILNLLENPYPDMDMQKFNEGIEMGLNHHQFSRNQLAYIIKLFTDPNSAIEANYAKDKIIATNRGSDSFTYNGKFHMLAELYAALGMVDESLASVYKILEDQPRYNTYATDGATVAGYFATYGHWQNLNSYVSGYAKKTGYKPYEIYRQIANRSGHITQTVNERFLYNIVFASTDLWYNPVLDYMPSDAMEGLYINYIASINKTASAGNERTFALALYHKQKGLFYAKRMQDKQINPSLWVDGVNEDFAQSYSFYQKTSNTYLDENINIYFHLFSLKPRREMYTFPDHIEYVASHAPRTRYNNYLSFSFLEYIIDRNLAEDIYTSAAELEQVITWIRDYKTARVQSGYQYEANLLDLNVLQKIDSALVNHKYGSEINNNMLLLIMATDLFKTEKTELAVEYANRINTIAIADLFNEEWFVPHHVTFGLIGKLYSGLLLNTQLDLAEDIRDKFSHLGNKVMLTDKAAATFYLNDNDSIGNIYYELADSIVGAGIDIGENNRIGHAYSTSLRGREGDFYKSRQQIRNTFGLFRNIGYVISVRATAQNGRYYSAYSGIPKFASSEVKLSTINEILYAQSFYKKEREWEMYDFNKDYWNTSLIYN